MSHQLLKNKKEIITWLQKYNVHSYELIPHDIYGYVVDVYGSVNLENKSLTHIAVKFNIVHINFVCSSNQLTSLKGCPEEVGNIFDCNFNKLKTLKYCPKSVGVSFVARQNAITHLKHFPVHVGKHVNLSGNELINLEGLPSKVNGSLICSNNNIETLKGCPEIILGSLQLTSNKLSLQSFESIPKIITDKVILNHNPQLKEHQDITNLGGLLVLAEKYKMDKLLPSIIKRNNYKI